MVQAEGYECPVEAAGLKRKSIGGTCALMVSGDRVIMPVTDVKHGQRLIDADNEPALQAFSHRAGHAAGAGSHIEHQLVAFERQHVCEFFCQIGANFRNPLVECHGVLRIVKVTLVPMAMRVFVLVSLFIDVMGMIVIV